MNRDFQTLRAWLTAGFFYGERAVGEPNFDACLTVTLAYEGGLSLLRGDPGNWTGGKVGLGIFKGTKFGIAASAFPTLDIAALTKADAAAIYHQKYWRASGADIEPVGLDLTIFDAAVNSGVARAKVWLAEAVGTPIQPVATVDAIHAYAKRRLSFLHAFRNWKAFGAGWGARVAGVEAKSLRMALGPSAEATSVIARKATKAKAQASSARRHARAGAIGATAGPTAFHLASSGSLLLAIVFGLFALACAGGIAFIALRQSQRAAALGAETSIPIRPVAKGSL